MEVYTREPVAELYLNGKRVGRKKTKQCRAVFQIKYAPGVLEAAVFDADGKERGRNRLESAKGTLHIQAEPEERTVRTGDIVYVDISIAGENGAVESGADTELSVDVRGGTLLGFGSAAPRTEERYDSGKYTTYHGYAQAVVRADVPGTIRVTVTGKGMKSAKAEITANER